MTIERQGGILICGDLMVDPGGGDIALAYAYLQYRASGLLSTIFTNHVPTLTEFMSVFAAIPKVGCYSRGAASPEMVGLGWLNSVDSLGDGRRRAELGVGFFDRGGFSDKHGFSSRLALGRMMLDWAFEDCGLDILVGTTPAPNRPARMYAALLGFTFQGPLPQFGAWAGAPADYWHLTMTREQWEKRRALCPAECQEV